MALRAPQSTIPNPYIDKILRGENPTPTDFVQTQQGNPFAGLNLAGMIGQSKGQPQTNAPQGGGVFNKIDSFLGKPGGMMLMNLLAQQGYSKMPQSRIGAVGRAALMTQNQQAAQAKAQAEADLMAAQGKYYNAKAGGEGAGGNEPLTTIAKLRADYQAGRIDAKVFEAERDKILRETSNNQFDQTKIMRGEFRTDTDTIRTSLGALVSAKNLVMQGNAISATAAFTSFIRSIDNSVVRPAEQAAYSSASGFARRLEDELSKLSGKGPLSEKTQADLLKSIETLEDQMNGIFDRTVDFYNGEAGKYYLDPESITGIPSARASAPKREDSFRGPMSHQYYDDPELTGIDAEIAEIDRQLGTR